MTTARKNLIYPAAQNVLDECLGHPLFLSSTTH